MEWIYDNDILRSLPPPYLRFARWKRLVDRIPGKRFYGRFVFSYLDRMQNELPEQLRATQSSGDTLVHFPGKKMMVDLYDKRALLVLDEARGTNQETRVLKDLLQSGDTFLDIGANHGSYSLAAAALVGASGRVISFEPQPHLAALIRQSAEANNWKQVTVIEKALSDQQGEATFFVPEAFSGMAGLHAEFSGADKHRTFTVELNRLDSILAQENLPGKLVIKIDVEGHEVPALRGAENLIRSRKPTLIFELNDMSLAAIGSSQKALLDTISGFGYTECSDLITYPKRVPLKSIQAESGSFVNVIAYPF
jgi:FkbM family methyltransferase